MAFSKNNLCLLFFVSAAIKAEHHGVAEIGRGNYHSPISGIIKKDLADRVNNPKAILLKDLDTVVKTVKIIVKNEETGEEEEKETAITIEEIIDGSPSKTYFINLANPESERNCGSFSKENPSFKKMIQEITLGKAISCEFAGGIHSIVSDKTQPQASICDSLRHHMLLLQFERENYVPTSSQVSNQKPVDNNEKSSIGFYYLMTHGLSAGAGALTLAAYSYSKINK